MSLDGRSRIQGHPNYLDSLRLEPLHLLEEARDVHHDSVAHKAQSLLVQDTGGNQVKGILVASVVIDGVASVRPALKEMHADRPIGT